MAGSSSPFDFEDGSIPDGTSGDTPTDPTELIDKSGEQFNPELHAVRDGKPIVTSSGKFRRKRGSKTGTEGTAPRAARNIPVSSYASSLAFVHAALAANLKTPELALNPEESNSLAQAIANVQQHYGKVLDPKTEAWIGLIVVAGTLYVPRAMQIKMRLDFEREQKRKNENDNINNFTETSV